jgi:hypothetical protein
MHSRLTLRLWGLSNHALRHQHPTGQGQNRALSVKKKKEIQQIVCGRVYSCRDTYTPNVYGKACEVDCEGLEATRSRLVPAVPHRSGSESNSIREKKNQIEQNVWRTFIHIRPLTHTPTHKACISTCQPLAMDVRLSGDGSCQRSFKNQGRKENEYQTVLA